MLYLYHLFLGWMLHLLDCWQPKAYRLCQPGSIIRQDLSSDKMDRGKFHSKGTGFLGIPWSSFHNNDWGDHSLFSLYRCSRLRSYLIESVQPQDILLSNHLNIVLGDNGKDCLNPCTFPWIFVSMMSHLLGTQSFH